MTATHKPAVNNHLMLIFLAGSKNEGKTKHVIENAINKRNQTTTEKFDAVELVKIAAFILGGKGGGGRKDFAQAGGQDQSKIDEAFEKLKTLI